MLIALGGLAAVVSLICWVLLLVGAFKSELWKGLLGLVCGLYLVYYTIAENQDKNKWVLLLGWIAASVVANVLFGMSGVGKPHGAPVM
jgi:hypothetical protein